MRSVRAVAPNSHVLFATDWPFSGPVFVVHGDPAPQLAETFTDAEPTGVLRDNALAQFPGLAARVASGS